MKAINKCFYFLILVISLIGLQCKSIHNSTSQRAVYKSIYVEQFKLTYFRQILIKSYNNSKAIQEIVRTDHSGFTEPILTEDDYKLIDSLTAVDNEKMIIDSTMGHQRAEGAQGKRPLGFILGRLDNKWLDSLAIKRYKTSGIRQSFKE